MIGPGVVLERTNSFIRRFSKSATFSPVPTHKPHLENQYRIQDPLQRTDCRFRPLRYRIGPDASVTTGLPGVASQARVMPEPAPCGWRPGGGAARNGGAPE